VPVVDALDRPDGVLVQHDKMDAFFASQFGELTHLRLVLKFIFFNVATAKTNNPIEHGANELPLFEQARDEHILLGWGVRRAVAGLERTASLNAIFGPLSHLAIAVLISQPVIEPVPPLFTPKQVRHRSNKPSPILVRKLNRPLAVGAAYPVSKVFGVIPLAIQ